MKILAIQGKNLASIEDTFVIDFTKEPLRSAGIFAITGPTGAGKSTILDAICLALFDDAPRFSKAETQVNITDVANKSIAQRDSRNILRRGAAHGFAQVDFIALNGNSYRSCWSVRRSRDKVNGALQNTVITLFNLTTSIEEQGTKTALLSKIEELIGLSFDQFTRAVLLAQGDFANFLKAKTPEKAQLLEKLTGTQIYSKISTLIHEKNQHAKLSLEQLQQRMADVHILSTHELEQLATQKENLRVELAPIEDSIKSVNLKINWLEQYRDVVKDKEEAQDRYNKISEDLKIAKPRFLYMEKVELSQQIRDVFINFKEIGAHTKKLNEDKLSKERELTTINDRYVLISGQLNDAKQELDKFEDYVSSKKPEIDRARELDATILAILPSLKESEQECSYLIKELEDNQNRVSILLSEQNLNSDKIKSIEEWFASNFLWKRVIPKSGVIIEIISNLYNILSQKEEIKKRYDLNINFLPELKQELAKLQEESAMLNSILPAEVIELRKKLIEGEPCLVCGSTVHPNRDLSNNTLSINEKELDLAKESIKKRVDQLVVAIASRESSIGLDSAKIEDLEQRYSNTYNGLTPLLTDIPDWSSMLQNGILISTIEQISEHWYKNEEYLKGYISVFEVNIVRVEAIQQRIDSIKMSLSKKQAVLNDYKERISSLTEQRSQLLKGSSLLDVESTIANKREELKSKLLLNQDKKEAIESQRSTITGAVIQINTQLEESKKLASSLESQLHEWLNNNRDLFTQELLSDVISKSTDWVTAEREYLLNLKNDELVALSTLKERELRVLNHLTTLKSVGFSSLEDSQLENESLAGKLKQFKDKQSDISNQLSVIEASLIAHNQGLDKIAHIKKEILQKSELSENWSKLNDLLGSANGNKFKVIAQGYTLDILLEYANTHLRDLSSRYSLIRVPESLALQISDNHMLGEIRSVYSLSGGESFLISLALALGLSSLSSNRMKIESLFIDEGFGSLDLETLSMAMDALDNLQTQGRKIGVISHVEEMKERISTQIQVIKESNGRSTIKIIN